MKKIIIIITTALFLVASCSFLTEDEIILDLPARIPLEEISGESIYYTLVYFDGEKVRSMHVPHHLKKVNVKVKKGLLSLFLLYPAEDFTPLSSFHEPGDSHTLSFSYSPSSLIEFLVTVAKESPLLSGNLSLKGLLERYDADEISKIEFLRALEKGKLNYSNIVRAEKREVVIESLIYGRWHSDRDDIKDIIVKESADAITLDLYEGVYIYIHEDLSQMLTIVVTDDGESLSKVESFRKWY